MGQFGSDGYLYDFAKRSPKDYMGQFGSDGYLYDFAKRSSKDYMGHFGSDGYLYDFAKRADREEKKNSDHWIKYSCVNKTFSLV